MEMSNMEESDISDDDLAKESTNETWFGMGMTQKEKIKSQTSIAKQPNYQIGGQNDWLPLSLETYKSNVENAS